MKRLSKQQESLVFSAVGLAALFLVLVAFNYLASLGAREIARDDFVRRLKVLVDCDPPQAWQFDDDLFA